MKKLLFIENEEDEDEDIFEVDVEPVFDTNADEEEILNRDRRETLIIRQSCMTPRAIEDDWLRNNIFQSTCTIPRKLC